MRVVETPKSNVRFCFASRRGRIRWLVRAVLSFCFEGKNKTKTKKNWRIARWTEPRKNNPSTGIRFGDWIVEPSQVNPGYGFARGKQNKTHRCTTPTRANKHPAHRMRGIGGNEGFSVERKRKIAQHTNASKSIVDRIHPRLSQFGKQRIETLENRISPLPYPSLSQSYNKGQCVK